MNLTTKYDDLVAELKTIFQMDNSDLDFGIYRIMNSQAKVINDYLTKDLRQDVEKAFASTDDAQRKQLVAERTEAEKNATAAGFDPALSPTVQKLNARIAALGKDTTADLEGQVYSHLLTFFSRYYDQGDFISKRRYNGDKYVIPYAGEEVKLVWANADQYYIKSSEMLSNYVFKLANGKTVAFRLVSASQEKDNIKEAKERRFILAKERTEKRTDAEGEEYDFEVKPFTITGDTLTLWFDYLPDDRKQPDLVLAACDHLMKNSAQWLKDFPDLAALCPTAKDKARTRLQKELENFVAKNTTDYFIHKDLGGFLNRELDNYLKTEVLDLEDEMDEASTRPYAQKLALMRTIRKIGQDLIAFMAQLENFQKKLWLKKKFVVQSDFCITLDRIEALADKKLAAKLLDAVWANEKQVQRWIDRGFLKTKASVNKARKDPASRFLMADTAFYGPDFKAALAAAIPDFDAQCDGLLVHSENFQALNLLQERYKEQVKCIYIDPPYNIGGDGFLYRDNYRHSSWLAMLRDRLQMSKSLLSRFGSNFTSIGKDEEGNLRVMLDECFAGRTIPYLWKSRTKPTNAGDAKYRPQIVGEFIYQNILDDNISYFPLLSGAERKYPNHDEYGNYRTSTILTSNLGRYQRETMRFKIAQYTPPLDKRWKAGYAEIKALYDNHRIGFNEDGEPFVKHYEGDEEEQHIPLWTYLPEEVTGTAESGKGDLSAILGNNHGLDTIKPKELIEVFLNAIAGENDTVFDYFAGSGTTGHAVINLNREDGGHRKYILVEMGHHFDTVLKPRIEKVVYSKEWKDGEPVASGEGAGDTLPGMGGNAYGGVSHCFKYMTLESYEDTLNNTFLTDVKTDELNLLPGDVKKDFFLRYMLDIKARGSVLSTKDFAHPFDYALNIAVDSAGAVEGRKIDLVETFNCLIGLRVGNTIDRREKDGIVLVDGTLPEGGRALVIWRDLTKAPNKSLEKLVAKLGLNLRSSTYAAVYVNGDTTLQTMKVPSATDPDGSIVPLHSLEEEFLSKMFAEV